MSIRTTIDAPDIRPDTIGPEHLKSDPDSLGKITGNVLRLFGDSIVIGTGKSLTHGSTVIVGSDAKVPWSVLKNHVSITAGEGLAGGGSLSGNVTLSVDSTVVRTTGNFTLSGVLTLNNNLIVSDGRVGIGTASPQHELHIESAAPVLRLHSSASNSPEGAKIRLTEDQWQGAYIHYEADANRLDIGVHETVDSLPESDIPVISILRSNRQVGIGTTSPSYPLHVSGDFGFTGTLQQGTVPWARLSGHPSIIAGTGLSGGGPLSSSQALSVVYGSTAGTAVEGNKQITITAGTNLSGGGTITLGAGGSVTVSVVDNPAFSVSVTTPLVTNTGTLTLKGDGTSGTIAFVTNDAERMRITSQGYVGIGTTAPSYALHVTGDVGFTGTLQQGTVPWARLSGHPSITAGTGLTGGGSLSASRTLSVNFGSDAGTVAEGNKTITVTAGSGLAGGGTVTIGAGGSVTLTNADPGSAQTIFKRIANSSGTVQFAAASNDDVLQFAAGTGLSVAFDAENKRITYSHALKAGTGIQVSGDTITNTGIISLSAGPGISVSGTNPATITNTDRGSDQSIFKNIANSSGTTQFSAGSNNDTIRFAAGGILSVSFNSTNKQVTYSASLTAGTNITVSGAQISTVSNPIFSTSVTTPSLISTSNLSLTVQGANNIIFVTNNTERMRIASSGNVGIGTNSPSETLHVQGRVLISSTGHETAGHLQVERVHNEQGNKLKVVISSDPGWQTGLLPNRSISLLSQEAASIALGFEDGQILPLVVSSQGRVGIGGKISPQYALDVTGDVAFSGTLQAGNIPAARITSGTLGVARGGTGRSSLASGQILFGAGTSAVGLDSNLYWDNSNKRLGIGTSAPAYPLDVAGDVRFTGTLQGGTVPWARLSGVPAASTSQAGIVQLNNTVTSTSTTQAATANAVKQAYDLAASKVSKSGDTMTGTLTIHNYALISAPPGLIAGNDAVFETIQGAVRSQIRAQGGNSANEAGLRVRVSGDSGSTWTDVLQVTPSTFTYGTNKVWHAGNDGAGSGLDADLVRGRNLAGELDAHVARTDNPHQTTATQVGALVSVDGVSNPGGDVDLTASDTVILQPDNTAKRIRIGTRKHPIFMQDGHLFHFDGTLMSTKGLQPLPGYVATLRPGEGRFGGAVAVEEGTTNLYSDGDYSSGNLPPVISAASDWAISTHTAEGTKPPQSGMSDRVLKHVATGGYNNWAGRDIPISPNTVYTASVWVWVSPNFAGSAVRLVIERATASGVSASADLSKKGQWQRLIVTFTSSSTATNARVLAYVYGATAGYVLYDGIQLEQKPFATSFVDGTRANGELRYRDEPAGGDSYTIALWAKASTNDPSTWQGLFDGRSGHSRAMLAFSTGDVLTVFYYNASTSASRSTGYAMPDRTGWHLYTLTFSGPRSSGTFRVYVDGMLVYEFQDSLRSPASGGAMYVGRGSPTSELWNGLLDELLILPYAASEEEIRAWYELQAPFYDPTPHIDADAQPIRAGRGAVVINEDGLRSYKDGQVTFEINTSGDAWFGGDVQARTFILPVRPA